MPPNRPKNPFNLNADPANIRDKDNTDPRHEPTQTAQPSAPNLAPPGMLGIRRGLFTMQHDPVREAGLSIDGGKVGEDLWIKGTINPMPGYSFSAKVYGEPSHYGIDGGCISKLEIRKHGEQVVSYERGWDMYPNTPEKREAVQRVLNGLDHSREREFRPIVPPDHNNDHDHDH